MAEDTSDLLTRIIAITAEEAGIPADRITRESRFAEDLDIDSLGLLTIATQVEESFSVSLDDDLIPTLPTVGSLVDLVTAQQA